MRAHSVFSRPGRRAGSPRPRSPRNVRGVANAVVLLLVLLALLVTTLGGCSRQTRVVESQRPTAPPPEGRVILGYGDVLNMRVYRNEDLDGVLRVDDAGYVHAPLAGRVQASGKTMEQLREALTKNLAAYVKEPQVSLVAEQLVSQRAVILGAVRSPGAVNVDRELSVWEVVAEAGGFLDTADEGRVVLVRQRPDKAYVYILNMDPTNPGEASQVAGRVEGGDIIFAPTTLFADVEAFMVSLSNIMRPFIDAQRFTVLLPQVRDALEALAEESDQAGGGGGGGSTIVVSP